MNDLKVARRLTALRKEHNIKQADLAVLIMEMSPVSRRTNLTTPVISSWETGRRTPSLEALEILAKIYDVTTDYLLCLTDDKHEVVEKIPNYTKYTNKNNFASNNDNVIDINIKHLNLFDGLPIFVCFNDYTHEDQWGIVNYTQKAIVMKNGIIDIFDKTIKTFLTDEPSYSSLVSYYSNYPLDYSRLLDSTSNIWIEMTTPDTYIQGKYNGWYRHNEDHSCLINAIGLTLPYEGVRISYNAYTKKKS